MQNREEFQTDLKPEFMIPEIEAKYNKLPYRFVERKMISGVRHYGFIIKNTENVHFLPGCTSIFKATRPMPDGLLEWYCSFPNKDAATQKLNQLADDGSVFHGLIAQLEEKGTLPTADFDKWCKYLDVEYLRYPNVQAIPDYLNKKIKKTHKYGRAEVLRRWVLSWLKFKKERKVKIRAVEICLIHSVHGFAFQTDILCDLEWKNKMVCGVTDIKTGEHLYGNAPDQLGMNKEGIELNFPGIKIDMVFNWQPSDSIDPLGKKGQGYTLTNQTEAMEKGFATTKLDILRWMHQTYDGDFRDYIARRIDFLFKKVAKVADKEQWLYKRSYKPVMDFVHDAHADKHPMELVRYQDFQRNFLETSGYVETEEIPALPVWSEPEPEEVPVKKLKHPEKVQLVLDAMKEGALGDLIVDWERPRECLKILGSSIRGKDKFAEGYMDIVANKGVLPEDLQELLRPDLYEKYVDSPAAPDLPTDEQKAEVLDAMKPIELPEGWTPALEHESIEHLDAQARYSHMLERGAITMAQYLYFIGQLDDTPQVASGETGDSPEIPKGGMTPLELAAADEFHGVPPAEEKPPKQIKEPQEGDTIERESADGFKTTYVYHAKKWWYPTKAPNSRRIPKFEGTWRIESPKQQSVLTEVFSQT